MSDLTHCAAAGTDADGMMKFSFDAHVFDCSYSYIIYITLRIQRESQMPRIVEAGAAEHA